MNVANGLFYLPGLDVYSGLTHAALHGTVSFNTSRVSASGMPSGSLTPGSTVTAHVQVKNTGVEPETYQLDPRTNTQTPYAGQSATNTGGTLPVALGDDIPQYLVSPFSSQLTVTTSTTGATPIEFDLGPVLGRAGHPLARQFGWDDERHGQQPVRVGMGACSVRGRSVRRAGDAGELLDGRHGHDAGFDNNAVPDTGDVWDNVVGGANETVNPLFLLPGQTGTMAITFTVPAGTAGTKVSGQVPVETFGINSLTSGIGDWSSDVLSVLHYSYTLG